MNKVPKVWVGSRGIERNASNRLSSATVYNRRTVVDVTDNQVAKSPFHHVSSLYPYRLNDSLVKILCQPHEISDI